MSGVIIMLGFCTLACVGLGVATLHVWKGLRRSLKIRKSGARIPGVCKSLRWRDGEASALFTYVLSNGKEYSGESFSVSHPLAESGQAVTVVYDPEDPENAEIENLLDLSIRAGRIVASFLIPVTTLLIVFDLLLLLTLFLSL
jgi:hypothetical protein